MTLGDKRLISRPQHNRYAKATRRICITIQGHAIEILAATGPNAEAFCSLLLSASLLSVFLFASMLTFAATLLPLLLIFVRLVGISFALALALAFGLGFALALACSCSFWLILPPGCLGG